MMDPCRIALGKRLLSLRAACEAPRNLGLACRLGALQLPRLLLLLSKFLSLALLLVIMLFLINLLECSLRLLHYDCLQPRSFLLLVLLTLFLLYHRVMCWDLKLIRKRDRHLLHSLI